MKTLSDKAGEIVGTMNTALSDNRTAIGKAFDANKVAVDASTEQGRAVLKESARSAWLDRRPWLDLRDTHCDKCTLELKPIPLIPEPGVYFPVLHGS